MCVESDRAHVAFARHLQAPFPLVSDFNRQVVRQFGIDYQENEPYGGWYGMSRRSVFIVDRDGTIRYAWVTEDPTIAPDIEDVIKAVEKLKSL
jgi:glutaredoxin-dependent peroxiredoxin